MDKKTDGNKQAGRPWSPYVAGGLTGVGITLALMISESNFGATPFYSYISKATYMLVTGESLLTTDVYGRYILMLRWPVMFAIGIPLGALIAALLFKEFRWQKVPPLWQARFGASPWKRWAWAFVGGIISIIGVRQAMGCPSGLGLTGMVALSLSGFLAFAMFFGGGVVLANLIYPRRLGTGGDNK